jgi:hypothetical protein
MKPDHNTFISPRFAGLKPGISRVAKLDATPHLRIAAGDVAVKWFINNGLD